MNVFQHIQEVGLGILRRNLSDLIYDFTAIESSKPGDLIFFLVNSAGTYCYVFDPAFNRQNPDLCTRVRTELGVIKHYAENLPREYDCAIAILVRGVEPSPAIQFEADQRILEAWKESGRTQAELSNFVTKSFNNITGTAIDLYSDDRYPFVLQFFQETIPRHTFKGQKVIIHCPFFYQQMKEFSEKNGCLESFESCFKRMDGFGPFFDSWTEVSEDHGDFYFEVLFRHYGETEILRYMNGGIIYHENENRWGVHT